LAHTAEPYIGRATRGTFVSTPCIREGFFRVAPDTRTKEQAMKIIVAIAALLTSAALTVPTVTAAEGNERQDVTA
jgi:hypothetical protein